mgnify:CR=1 FL=1
MSTDAEVATAVAYIARHSQAGLAPAVNWYEATCTANGCRSLAYLRKHAGLRYVDLVLLAGMEPRGGMARTMASRRSRPQRRAGVPDEVEAQVEQEERHRAGWRDPHRAIHRHAQGRRPRPSNQAVFQPAMRKGHAHL